MKFKGFYTTAVLIVAVLVFVNLVSDQFFVRLDFTEDHQYTLSKATKDIIKNLDDPVTVKAYFSKGLPPYIAKTRKDFMDMLVEYSSVSKGMVVYEFVDPSKNQEMESEAQQAGIQPVMINVREKDQMKQQKAYMGAVVTKGDEKEVIPFVQPGGAMEYDLSTSIKKITVTDKPKVALLQGHGEPSIMEMAQVAQGLSVMYQFEPLSISDTTVISKDIKTIAIVRPTDSLPVYALRQLDAFLARGGRIFIGINRVQGNLQNASGSILNTQLESWLANKGVLVKPDFIVDAKCGAVTVQQQQGMFRFSSNVSFPFLPVISTFADHPITKGLESVILQFASPLTYSGDTSLTFTPIAFTSDKAGSLAAPQYFNIQKKWTATDFPQKNLVVAGVLEGNIVGNQASKMVIVTDGDFPVGGSGNQQINPDNANFMINSIDFLSDDTGLIGLRTRGVTSRPIKEMEDSSKALLKYLNFLLPLILVVIYGLLRYQRTRVIRMHRVEENYDK